MAGRLDVTRGVLHVHTRRSFDSVTRPERIVAEALCRGLDFVAVCDHDDLAGAQEVRAAAARLGGARRVAVLVGAEYRSDDGDLICLGIERRIDAREPAALIAATHRQGGLVILPHPYKQHRHVEQLAASVDLIEVVNARCSPRQNAKAAALAARHGKPAIAGADAHMVHQIRHCQIEFEGRWDLTCPTAVRHMLLHARRRILLRRGPDVAAEPLSLLTSLIHWDGLLLRIQKGIVVAGRCGERYRAGSRPP
jgi:predicted metal-dependent phosphoesterase TrpH